MATDFELLLFSTDPLLIRQVTAAGVGGVVVDWERIGKAQRQASYDTQINHDTVADLRRVRACTDGLVICRINGYGATTEAEVELAVAAGADEILLPMVRTPAAVMSVMDKVGGRCGVGILVETVAAIRAIDDFARLPLTRMYVGLNDLGIERGTENIFAALVDGTVERVRRACRVPFGFAGLTLPELGHPVPCRLLIAEMARLGADFSFLRRSFHRDIRGRDPTVEIPRLLEALRRAGHRSGARVERDWRDLALLLGPATWPADRAAGEAMASIDGWATR
jgi:hypothetical protein